MSLLIGLFLSLFIAVQATAEEAEYYTWVDENGVVNYAERNPQGYQAEYVTRSKRFGFSANAFAETDAATETQTSQTSNDEATPDLASDEAYQQEMAQLERDLAEEEAIRTSNCRVGRLNVTRLSNFSRVRVEDENGEVRILSDEEKQSRLKAAQKTVEENC